MLVAFALLAVLALSAATASSARAADACPNAAVRAQQHATDLPDCRAYEQVSPVDKNGSPVFYFPDSESDFGNTGATRSGDVAIFTALTPFANSTHGVEETQRAHRTATGWSSASVSPAPTVLNPFFFGEGVAQWKSTSSSLDFGLVATSNVWSPDDRNSGAWTGSDLYRVSADRVPTLISKAPDGSATGGVDGLVGAGTSEDGGTVVFGTTTNLVPEDTSAADVLNLYERTGDQTRLVDVDPSGTGPTNSCGAKLASTITPLASTQGAPSDSVSQDGKTIVFVSGDYGCGPARLFVRLDGERTVQISASRRTTPDLEGAIGADFIALSRDGKRVLFTSSDRLTDDVEDSNNYLYEYRTDTDELRYMGLEADPADKVVGVSQDAARIYFVSYEDLAAGATAFNENLYVLEGGHITWLATQATAGTLAGDLREQSVLSPDGRSLVFRAQGDLGFGDSGATRQVYLHREGAPLACVSCRGGRADLMTDARLALGEGSLRAMRRGTFASSVSDDGKTVIFDTGDGLSPADTNNRRDVYLWQEGKVSLLSSGRLDAVAYVLGVSSDGRDAFLGTSASLHAGDVDGGDLDIYDARVGGGFLAPEQVPAVPCAGDLCQGAGTPLSAGGAQGGSVDLRGAGNGPAPARNRLTVVKPGAKALATAARTGVVSLTARVTQPSNVLTLLSAKHAARGKVTWRKIDVASRRLSGGRGTVLRLRLDRAALQELRAKRRLSLRIEVRVGGLAPQTVSIVLRRAAR